ncbi:MAG: Indole-3-pyruvate decarboxylase [Chlamydiia bacterium]|nr:Indole-3-pyruvate decarboxylase [Chlamydiia bacterium]
MDITVGELLLKRLSEVGIDHIFGVPGDYNLGFLDLVDDDKNLDWMGTCNELNGAYAADGYARIKGLSALVTTYGVGEMSALNGVAGAYSEYVPMIHIVGMPARPIQEEKLVMHHSLPGKPYDVFMKMSSEITNMQCMLTEENALEMIDASILTCWQTKRPVYIGIPTDVVSKKVKCPKKPLMLHYPSSDTESLDEAANEIKKLLKEAKQPAILVDLCASRHKMYPLIEQLVEKGNIPYASMNLAKGIIDESHPLFLGDYAGALSSNHVKEYIEGADCVITFGLMISDFNTGGFTVSINPHSSIEVHSNYVAIRKAHYENVYFNDLLPKLIKEVPKSSRKHKIVKAKPKAQKAEKSKITQARLWNQMNGFLKEDSVVIAEVGTSMFGALEMQLPKDTFFISQYLWVSIGYSVGALFGTLTANKERENILFVGDGSFQMTAQEISSMLRYNLTPIIFLINNDGYTIERVIHGPERLYNAIQMWDYKEFPKSLGSNIWTTKVKSEKDLAKAFLELRRHPDKLRFVEIEMDKMDAPESLLRVAEACSKINRYAS